jgi:DNA-binding SARP family transcriptional activator
MLGAFDCLYDDHPLKKLPHGRLLSLFAYLLLHHDTLINRRSLAFQFWPDSSEQQALTNLRKLLHDLRSLLPASEKQLTMRDGQLGWHTLGNCQLDVYDFEHFGKSNLQNDLELALTCYKGELLPGIYEDWVVELRETLLVQYKSILERMIEIMENKRKYTDALLYATRLLQADPLSESAHLRIARLHVMQGNSAAARKQYEDMTIKLRDELGLFPSSITDAAFKDLLIRADDLIPNSPDRRQAPLFGRNREWEELLQSWQKAIREKSMLVVMEGEAGIGKTRLAEEFAWWSRNQGIRTLMANCFPSGASSSYETIASWLEQVEWGHLDSGTLSEISRILPAVREHHPGLVSPSPIQESGQLRQLYQATELALLDGKPTILILDDLQWSDKETLEMLNYFLRSDRPSTFLILCTLRSGFQNRETETQKFIEFQRQSRKLVHLTIHPPGESETHLLIQSIHNPNSSTIDTRQIYEESGGNPLFIHEILRADQTGYRNEDFGSTVISLMMQRLADLPHTSKSFVDVMAVLEKPAPLSFLTEFADTPEHAAEQSDLLLRLRIFKLTDKGLLDFYHERMRAAAEFGLSSSHKILIHGQVARAMVHHSNPYFFTTVEIAYHYELAGMEQEGVPYLIQALTEAIGIYAHHKVIHYGEKAFSLANPVQQRRRLIECQVSGRRPRTPTVLG